MSNIEGYENLANAIVMTAVQDYLPYYTRPRSRSS